jgi:glutamate N-acetyltransferase/amino-acid N-acetyltransferase
MNPSETDIQFPQGFSAGGVAAGIKQAKELDLGVLISEIPSRTFGAFTTNKFCAAPVEHCRRVLASGKRVSHLLVNSGNANACTGEQGVKDVAETVRIINGNFSGVHGVLICSTGIIGQLLPMERIRTGIKILTAEVHSAPSDSFVHAIMTTDTVPKVVQSALLIEGREVRIGGAAKGAGMICPHMATMLAFITTDIDLPESYQARFSDIVEKSFNSISVDGDMSTNDTVLLFSNGASQVNYDKLSKSARNKFDRGLLLQFQSLAKQIVKDGEGATKLIQIKVSGAVSETHAKCACRAVANSPLVKTAFFGKDPNWGRVVAALGSHVKEIIPEKLDLSFCGEQVLSRGQPLRFLKSDLCNKLDQEEVSVEINLNMGESAWTYWTCDLTYDYIKINAEYHT